jgi:carbonic anhydrase
VELHFVHESRDGEAAVLAVMLEEGAANPAFDSLLDHMDQPQDAVAIAQIPWQGLVPQDLRTVRFDGSLTTPSAAKGSRGTWPSRRFR